MGTHTDKKKKDKFRTSRKTVRQTDRNTDVKLPIHYSCSLCEFTLQQSLQLFRQFLKLLHKNKTKNCFDWEKGGISIALPFFSFLYLQLHSLVTGEGFRTKIIQCCINFGFALYSKYPKTTPSLEFHDFTILLLRMLL